MCHPPLHHTARIRIGPKANIQAFYLPIKKLPLAERELVPISHQKQPQRLKPEQKDGIEFTGGARFASNPPNLPAKQKRSRRRELKR